MGKNDDYQWLFRKAPAMATAFDEDGRYLDVNDAFERRLGYGREEMIGRPPQDFVTAESARRIEEEFRPALRRTGKQWKKWAAGPASRRAASSTHQSRRRSEGTSPPSPAHAFA